MRIITRKLLRELLTKTLPNPNSKLATQDSAILELPPITMPNGQLLPTVKIRFQKMRVADQTGTIKWRWAYQGPLPYVDDEMVIDQDEKVDAEPDFKTEKLIVS